MRGRPHEPRTHRPGEGTGSREEHGHGPQQGHHLRHDAAGRGAVPRDLAERDREARDRAPARPARRRRDRGRLPHRLAGRLRRRPRDRARGPRARSSPGSRAPTPTDIDRAYEAVRDAERPRIHTFISTSDIHIEHQLQSTREDVKGQARAAVAHARALVEDVEFSPMDATRADVGYTAEVVQIAVDEGATTINIPDTVGYATPDEYAAYLRRLYELVPGLARRRASPSTATTTSASRWPTRWPACRRAPARWSAPSTGSASGRATPRSRRS